MGRGEVTLVCESAKQIQLSQTNFSDEVGLITYSHLSFDLAQNKPKKNECFKEGTWSRRLLSKRSTPVWVNPDLRPFGFYYF
jgi:hypothetical protein